MHDVAETVGAVAAFGLPETTIEPPSPIEPDEWQLVLAQLEHEKLTGIALAAAEDGWLPLKGDQFESLIDRHRDAMAWCLRLERLLLDVADAFEREGIGFLVLKGPAVARVAYPDPSWRAFRDLDLLVRTEDWRLAVALLEQDFGPRRIQEPRRRFDERFSKGAVFTSAMGGQIDLHRTLASGAFSQWIVPQDLFDSAVAFTIAGRQVERPDDVGLFVHACVHAILGDEGTVIPSFRDVLQLAATGQFDGATLQCLADRWRIGHVCRSALALASKELRQADQALINEFGSVDTRSAAAVRAVLTRNRARIELETLRAIPSVRAKGAYLRATLMPTRESLRTRFGERSQGTFGRWSALLPKRKNDRAAGRAGLEGLEDGPKR